MSTISILDVAKSLFQIIREYVDKGLTEEQLYGLIRKSPIILERNCHILKKAIVDFDIVSLCEKWRSVFCGQLKPTEKEALAFIAEIHAGIEANFFKVDRSCIASGDISKRGDWSDFIVHKQGVKTGIKAGWSIHLATSGGAEYKCANKTLKASVGDLVLLSPIAYYDFKRSDDYDELERLWCIFPSESHLVDLLTWPEVASGVFHIRCDDKEHVLKYISIFKEIESLSKNDDKLSIRMRRNLVEQLLLRVKKHIPENTKCPVDQRVHKAIKFIEDNFCEAIDNEVIAAAVATSPSNLIRLFKREVGMSALALRDNKRMSFAADKLANSKLTICEIANLLGYSDQMYFSRCFKKNFGISPTSYRQRYFSWSTLQLARTIDSPT
ncbi:AraC family transcriptional regulator [Photobacterium sagamiensis]|uniref:helix-turn-helix domain-containing protein n=1 Tax=Photobacterium sagamiensis TaxID=2910241 RepID=UPI003D10057A